MSKVINNFFFINFIFSLILCFAARGNVVPETESLSLSKNHKKAIAYECKHLKKDSYDSRSLCKQSLTLDIKKKGVLFNLSDFSKKKIKKAELNCSAKIKKGVNNYNDCLIKVLNVKIAVLIPPIIELPGEPGNIEDDPEKIATVDDVYRKVLPSTYYVIADDDNNKGGAQGTAVGIRKNYFATNCHVLFNDKKNRWFNNLYIINVDDDFSMRTNWKIMKLFKSDQDSDRCILFNANINNFFVKIKKISEIKINEVVLAVGNPEGHPGVLTQGVGQRVYKANSPPHIFPIELIQTNTHIRPGSSGGGLYDMEGNLIGITTLGQIKKSNNPFNFAIAAERFNELF